MSGMKWSEWIIRKIQVIQSRIMTCVQNSVTVVILESAWMLMQKVFELALAHNNRKTNHLETQQPRRDYEAKKYFVYNTIVVTVSMIRKNRARSSGI